jgi:uncharacterized protein YecE (DUF72 family)
MSELRIGISGWTYRPWRGTFYPKGLAQKRELEYASRQVNSVEINGSFYSLQTPKSYAAWRDQTPENFVFAVKGGRFITHLKRLGDIEVPLANFFASGVLRLGPKLGPILWQLPPMFPFDEKKLARFFSLLPRDTEAAAALARNHDHRLEKRNWTETDDLRPIRHALEVRHPTFEQPRFVELLREHHIALVAADTAGKWPFLEDVTSDFVYVRLHGDEELYVSGYTDESLDTWARKIKAWYRGTNPRGTKTVGSPAERRVEGRDVYVYFDNDVKVRAPYDAMMLAHKLGIGPRPDAPPSPETIAETARTIWPSVVSRWQFRRPAVSASPATPAKRASAARSASRAAK